MRHAARIKEPYRKARSSIPLPFALGKYKRIRPETEVSVPRNAIFDVLTSAINPSGIGSGDRLNTPSNSIGAPDVMLPLSMRTRTRSDLMEAFSIVDDIIPATKKATMVTATANRCSRIMNATDPTNRHKATKIDVVTLIGSAARIPPANAAASQSSGWRSYSRVLRSSAIKYHLFGPDRGTQHLKTRLTHSANL